MIMLRVDIEVLYYTSRSLSDFPMRPFSERNSSYVKITIWRENVILFPKHLETFDCCMLENIFRSDYLKCLKPNAHRRVQSIHVFITQSPWTKNVCNSVQVFEKTRPLWWLVITKTELNYRCLPCAIYFCKLMLI